MTNSRNQASIHDEQLDSGKAAAAARLLPSVAFGARAAVLAGVVATTCATAAPAASAAVSSAAAAPVSSTVTLDGPAGGFITPRDSTCCM
jgi:hypothetical protein